MKLVSDNLLYNPLRQNDFFEPCQGLDVVAKWAETSPDTGAAASLATDGDNAIILTTGATNNNECDLSSNQKFDVVANQPLLIEGQIKYTEANTDDANIMFGLCSAAAADSLVDDGAGPAASYSGAIFYKVDGGTAWVVQTSVGSTRYGTNTVNGITPGGGAYQSFRIEIRPISATEAEVVFSIDPNGGTNFQVCRDATTKALIKHIITYTSFAAAGLRLYVKAGAANSETPRFRNLRVSQIL